jgi:transposase-like protein
MLLQLQKTAQSYFHGGFQPERGEVFIGGLGSVSGSLSRNPCWRRARVQTCPTGPSDRVLRHGSAARKPQKPCQPCGDQETCTTPRGKPLATKINAVLWYVSGMAMHSIALLLRGSAQAVLPWMRHLAKDSYKQPEPCGRIIVLERDAMGHDLKKTWCRVEPMVTHPGSDR